MKWLQVPNLKRKFAYWSAEFEIEGWFCGFVSVKLRLITFLFIFPVLTLDWANLRLIQVKFRVFELLGVLSCISAIPS